MDLDTDAGAAPAAAETPAVASAPEAPSAPAPAPEAPPPAQPSQRDSLEAIWNKHNPPRGTDGKFAGQDRQAEAEQPAHESTPETPAEPAVETGEAGETETPDQPEEEATVEPATPAIDAPNSWPGPMKAKWGSIPPDVQKYVLDRESEVHKTISEQGQVVKAIQPFAELLGTHRAAFEQQNVTPFQGVAALLNAHKRLQDDPVTFVRNLVEEYQINLAELAESSREQTQPDPEVLALKREIGEVKHHLTAAQRAQHEASMAAAARDLEAFAKDHPHLNEPGVGPLMGVLIQSRQADDLETAYEMAIHANPALRQRILDDQRKAESDKRAAEEAKRKQEEAAEAKRKKAESDKAAAEARKAAAVNVRSGSGASPTAPKSMRESLEAVADRLMP